MANKILIEFQAKGAGQLKGVIDNLASSQGKLEKAYNKVNTEQDKNNKISPLNIRNNRLLSNTFATLRSKLLLASFGMALVNKTIGSMVKLFSEQQLAEKKLQQALGFTSNALLNQASALQKVSAFGDETIISAQAMLAAFVKDEDQLKKATQATLDLAAAKGMDLASAADLVGKTLGSSTNSLSRYGIEVEGVVGSTERLDSLTNDIADTFGGQAKAQAETLSGSIEQMKNAMGDTGEVIGEVLAPAIITTAKFLKSAAEGARDFIRSLTETPLETTIRELEALGVQSESLMKLKNIQLGKEIRVLNNELKEVNTEKLTSLDIDKRLEEITQERISVTEALGEKQSKMSDDALSRLKQEVAGVRQRHMADMFRQEEGNRLRSDNDKAEKLMRETIAKLYEDFYSNAGEEEKVRLDDLANEEEMLASIAVILAKIAGLEAQTANIKKEDAEARKTENELQQNLLLEQSKNNLLVAEGQMLSLQSQLKNIALEKEFIESSNAISEEQRQTKLNNLQVKKIGLIKEEVKSAMQLGASYKHAGQAAAEAAREAVRAKIREITANFLSNVLATVPFPASLFVVPAASAGLSSMLETAFNDIGSAITFEQGGYVGGRRHSQGGTMIEAERGEFVMSRSAVESIGVNNLEAMNAGGGASIVINNPIISSEFVESELPDLIAEAVRKGADFGMS